MADTSAATPSNLVREGVEFNGLFDMLAQITPLEWGVTAGIVVLAFALTWLLRFWLNRRSVNRVVPSWLNPDMLTAFVLPILLWLFADVLRQYDEARGHSDGWFQFLTKIFGAFLLVRLFLFMERRALPSKGQTRKIIERVVVALIWGLMFLNYIGKLDVWINSLEALQVTIGKNHISAANVLALVFVLALVWLVVKWLNHEMENLLITRPNSYFGQFDLSARAVLVRIFKAVFIVAGVLFALTAVGIDLTVLSVFGGALGVGLGLGLQKIASNYVSGFVILFERSIRIGDLVTMGDGFRGNVSQINARYTIIKGVDGNEVLMPNETLITQPVVNWSLTDKSMWMSTSIQLKFETDLELIRNELLQAISVVPRVLETPAPNVLLASITEKGFVLDVTWWINDPENGRQNITSDINFAIWRTCVKHHIEFFTMLVPPDEKPKQD